VGLLVLLTVKGEVTLRYMERTAGAIVASSVYAQGVLGAPRAEEAESGE
jgi:hypothetical protein